MADRSITAAFEAELTSGRIRLATLVEIEFDSGFVRFWSGIGNLSWDSKTWVGAGDLLQVANVTESVEVVPRMAAFKLSGINQANISLALQEARRGKPIKQWLAFFDQDDKIVADPYLAFAGTVDSVTIEEGGKSATITVNGEGRLIDLKRVRMRRYTSADQKNEYADDKGFDLVYLIQEWQGTWGSSFVNPR